MPSTEQPSTEQPTTDRHADQLAVLRRRARRTGALAAVSLLVAAVLGGLLVARDDDGPATDLGDDRPGGPPPAQVEQLIASLAAEPVDPRQVELVSSVSTFADCDALIGDLRRIGAEHVGSRGFGGFVDVYGGGVAEDSAGEQAATFDAGVAAPAGRSQAAAEPTTLGTNVQVAGVDELDVVKAAGTLIYDLDRRGDLRITDTATSQVLATLDVTPGGIFGEGEGEGEDGDRSHPGGPSDVRQLLVADGRVALFGSETEVSEPVAGDPSATRASTEFMTVTFVDATDPASPTVTDRVRIEGSLVSARLVDGEIRLVTGSNMADLGFVMPTTPTSVAKALEQNRRSVATSAAEDWIPDWQRRGEEPQPLVPCARVHVPETFSGVAMTSMVTFPLGGGRFEPAGTSILAPSTTLYAGLEKVAISSEVWVDPIDRERLEFDDWQTAVHEFGFADDAAPTYVGSGIVDGSTIGQFAFGEIDDSLAVVTTKGTPWQQDPTVGIDLTILTPDGDGGLAAASKVADLSNGRGEVTAVRFVEGRVLVSTGSFGREVYVIDVTEPGRPRRAGNVGLPGMAGYFHPLPNGQALVIGSRVDQVGEGRQQRSRSWVQAHLLDVTDADAPRIVSTWERPWVADGVAADHHAFTYWPDRRLAMWGLYDTQGDDAPNAAAVLGTVDGVSEVAVPVASKPNEVAPPCPVVAVTDPDIRDQLGPDDEVLRCADTAVQELEWPRFECYRLDGGTVARYAPGEEDAAAFFVCSPAPQPTVARVLVVAGIPMLYTDQTIEALDPETFASTAITYHPSSGAIGY
ncbi:MAG TPA: beta-propeller domain-containing protein [Aquihabitans sp.]|nr:beta-propeller domain-containing protein [Aquihabitans sp.]